MRNTIFILFGLLAVQSCSGEIQAYKTEAEPALKLDTPVASIDTINSVQPAVWSFSDPYEKLSDREVLKLYNDSLKPFAQQLRTSTISSDSAFYEALKQLWPAWYGTTWDFNGYTHKPREGNIACGYFVSTSLRDVGLKLNRYDLAKLYSHAICTTICGTQVKEFSLLEDVISHIQNRPKDIYIVGLDSHVGFLIKENNEVFFVHSNYLGESVVTKELAENSEALEGSNMYVLGSILSNNDILNHWQQGTTIQIQKE
ncbi:MAG: hypothetical protein CL833_16045 [Crocinitomicaceae bacterium]|nr:hypothetical protein [Crocinitomicaceae bacterium]